MRFTNRVVVVVVAAADLDMFSMFGRTGAPQKRGPTRGAAIFCNIANMPEIIGDTRANE